MKPHPFAVSLVFSCLLFSFPARSAPQVYPEDSLIIPMDLTFQDRGMFQAYGLLFQLLRQGVTVHWVIDPLKVWHHAPCNTPGNECSWDCEEEGSGAKCPYPTASPDFFASAEVIWDDRGLRPPGHVVELHGYRGGPFVIDATQADHAMEIIGIWNDPGQWQFHPWAQRTVSEVVSVHRATASFEGNVRKVMNAAPTIAVFSDGNENIATKYLRAAGIRQSNGLEFPAGKCAAGACGPGTDNPDMLTVESIMGEMGTCSEPNYDHRNGALFTEDRMPAYCQIMSMHWNVADREKVQCDGGNCPATQDQCTNQVITYHGHEVVAEVRQFLQHRTHFFAQCQAVNAYENTVPNPQWPWLDDEDRLGHFLTTVGVPPDCPCTDAKFACVVNGCDEGTRDCCIPKDAKEKGAGFLIAARPASETLQILHPHVPYMQMDGSFATVGGSEPAYNLSEYLGTTYQNDMDVTFITGPEGPGKADVWMTGYIDGSCSVTDDDVWLPQQCTKGKVSYLGGHEYEVRLPISANGASQGTRLFLNALFEADCVSAEGQPRLWLNWNGELIVAAAPDSLPLTQRYSLMYQNTGGGGALDTELFALVPAGVVLEDAESPFTQDWDELKWATGNIGAMGDVNPPSSGSRWMDVTFGDLGDYGFSARMRYRVGVSTLEVSQQVVVRVLLDTDGDGVPDEFDPFPEDPDRCGDADGDGCDDCAPEGTCDPDPDPDPDPDGRYNAAGSCLCRAGTGTPPAVPLLFLFFLVGLVFRRRLS